MSYSTSRRKKKPAKGIMPASQRESPFVLHPSKTFLFNGSWPYMDRAKITSPVCTFFSTHQVNAYHTSSTTLETFANHVILASNFANFAGWATVFDQYRIMKVEIWVTPRTAPVATTSVPGRYVSVIDYDDVANFASVADSLEFDTAVVSTGSTAHYRCFQPRVAAAVYGGAFTKFASPDPGLWLDVANADIQHYGLKTAWTATDSVYIYDLVIRAVFQFKGVR